MSGGVDSSVAAYLLKEQGYDVVGLFMRMGVEFPAACTTERTCCSAADAADARRVADQLGIPFYVLNFKDEFERIIVYFCDEYNRGRTPNPCVLCNRDLKFGKLFQYAQEIGAEYVATGHYARIVEKDGERFLQKGVDRRKDQSYVLFTIRKADLARILFPVGDLKKDEVRAIARKLNLKVKNKLESQDICFVPDKDYRTLLKERTPDKIVGGLIRDTEGNVLGTHEGYQFFTLGQRKGLKIAAGKPIYVQRIDAETHDVIVSTNRKLYTRGLYAEEVNWLAEPDFDDEGFCRCKATIRYSQPPRAAWITKEGDRVLVKFKYKVRAVTPGQAAVFYKGETVLGGGWIAGDFPQLDEPEESDAAEMNQVDEEIEPG